MPPARFVSSKLQRRIGLAVWITAVGSTMREELEASLECIYRFVDAFIEEHGYSPSLREIGAACHLGRTTVSRYLDKLEGQGKIAREIGRARSIRILADF